MKKIKFTEIIKLGSYSHKDIHYKITKKYGKNSMFQAFNTDYLITYDTNTVQKILSSKEHAQNRSSMYHLFQKIKGLNGILFLDGDKYQSHKKALVHFYNPTHWLKYDFSTTINDFFSNKAENNNFFEVNLFEDFYDFGLDTFLLFSLDWKPGDTHSATLKKQLNDYFINHSKSTNLFDCSLKSPSTILTILKSRHKRNKIASEIRSFLTPLFKNNPPLLVKKMLNEGLDDNAITDEVIHQFGAYKAVINTVIFAIYELGKHPEWVDKLRAELSSRPYKDDIKNNTLKDYETLINIMKETARLYTISLTVMRQLGSNLTVDDKEFKKGSEVIILLSLLHNNPEDWIKPELFNPDRWVSNNEYFIPFLLGPRQCLGRKFAENFFCVCLSEIVLNYDISSSNNEIQFKSQPYPEPNSPLIVNFTSRE